MATSKINTCSPLIPSRFPWLVYIHGKRSNTQTFYNIEKGDYEIKKIPDLSNTHACANSHGWTVMVDKGITSDICFLLNLVSMEKIKLPPWKSDAMPMFCILTLPPSDPKSIVAFFDSGRSHVKFCRPGEKVWRESEFDIGNYGLVEVISNNEGKIYCFIPNNISTLMEMKVLDFHGSEIRQFQVEKIELPTWEAPVSHHIQSHLIESLGEIFYVTVVYYLTKCKIKDVYVCKRDSKMAKWIRVNNLGSHRVFFISEQISMSCSSIGVASHAKENSIYIVNPIINNEIEKTSTFVYDMEEKTITTCKFCPNVVYNVSEVYWMM